MTDNRHLCPVCYRRVTRTGRGHIGGHFDKAGHPCPGSYQPFAITSSPPPAGGAA